MHSDRHAAAVDIDAPPRSASDRPDFMKLLGLLPPYSEDDIHKAYKARAVTLHPDHGGSPEEFVRLQEAYGQAQEYIRRSLLNRDWLARHVEPYVRQQELADEIRRRGGEPRVEKIGWAESSLGDYAALLERICALDLHGLSDADGLFAYLAGYADDLQSVTEIDLSGSDLTDAGLAQLGALRIQRLKRLNLSGTRITAKMLTTLLIAPHLEWLHLGDVRTGWLTRLSLRRRLSGVSIRYA